MSFVSFVVQVLVSVHPELEVFYVILRSEATKNLKIPRTYRDSSLRSE
jgi:hypothetical protein